MSDRLLPISVFKAATNSCRRAAGVLPAAEEKTPGDAASAADLAELRFVREGGPGLGGAKLGVEQEPVVR